MYMGDCLFHMIFYEKLKFLDNMFLMCFTCLWDSRCLTFPQDISHYAHSKSLMLD